MPYFFHWQICWRKWSYKTYRKLAYEIDGVPRYANSISIGPIRLNWYSKG